MKNIADKIRSAFLFVLILAAMSYSCIELMKIQIVDGDKYVEMAHSTTLGTQVVNSPRGEIVDINGKAIVSNKVGFNVIVEKAFFPSDDQEMNRIILEAAMLLQECDTEWIDTLPISMTKPYKFLDSRDSDIKKLRENIGVQAYATAGECIDAMAVKYKIPDDYTDEETRIVAGIRYEMFIRSFSVANRYTFAEDIPMDTVVRLKEASYDMDGVDIIEEAVRVYEQGDVIPHLIGAIGPIDAEEYELHKSEGYALNDVIGKSGIEKAMEEYLRGKKGTRTISFLNGTVVADEITEEAVPGNTVQLTIDSNYQKKVQKILENHIEWLQNQTSPLKKGDAANAGAIVVLNSDTGAILAAATSPTYNLNEYLSNYSAVLNGENSPLTNRATSGLYRPGSTFKTVTATAALNEGFITPQTQISCSTVYTYWEDFQPKDTAAPGLYNVVGALKVSSNSFFYEVGRRMGIDTLAYYAELYGLSKETGLETGGASGWIATPDSFTERKLEWQAGNVVMAAIGQSETYVTPLQMAVIAETIANSGVRNQPHLVDSIHTYNMEQLVNKTPVVAAEKIEDKTGYTFDAVIDGMIEAANFTAYTYPNESDYYTDYLLIKLDGQAAIKTGTPQMTSAEDTGSAFIGFYPADDPQIAFAGFIEHGEYSKLMIKQIIDAYYNEDYAVPNTVPQKNKADQTKVLSDTVQTTPVTTVTSSVETVASTETTFETTQTGTDAEE